MRKFFTVLLVLLALPGVEARGNTQRDLRRAADRLRSKLGLDHPVVVVVVPHDPHVASVATPRKAGDAFEVRIEARLLDLLDASELEAVVAHELGHVWVFTHHPFLQTEQLANEIALRVVSRDALTRVYEKVWKADASKGDLASFLPADPAAARPAAPGQQH